MQRLVYKGRCAKVGVKRLVYKGWCTKVDVRKAMSDILSEGPSLERNVILRIVFLIFSIVFVVYLLVPPAHTINLPSIV